MPLRDRVRELEKSLLPNDAYRLLFVQNGADQESEITKYRERTGYTGPVICLDETDAKL